MRPDGNRPTYAIVDRERFGKNIDVARELSNSDIIAVLKADAYGHGAAVLAEYAYRDKGVRHFAVATMGEALELKECLPEDASVIIFGYVNVNSIPEAIEKGLVLPVFDEEYAKNVCAAAAAAGKKAKTALEIDTGMSRLGFPYDLNVVDFLSKYVYIDIVFVISHLATSDSDGGYAHVQTERFDRFLELNKGFGFATSFLNSSGIAGFENRWNYARPGLMLYGYESSGFLSERLKPVMSVRSEIAHVKHLKAGETVGYGRTYCAKKDMIIGVVPIGYADGYSRSFSNKAYMLCGGVKCPVVGNVCMDMTMIDVSAVGAECRGRRVEVLGDGITADLWAEWAGTINYEILCGISARIPRIYESF